MMNGEDTDWVEIAGKRVAALPAVLSPEIAQELLTDPRCKTHGEIIPCLEVPVALAASFQLCAKDAVKSVYYLKRAVRERAGSARAAEEATLANANA